MTLRDRVPVEPLGEARLDRVERRLFEAMDRGEAARKAPVGPRRPIWVGAGMGAAALAVVLVVLMAKRHGEVTATTTTTKIVTPAGSAPTVVELGDAVISVAPGSSLSIARLTGGEIDVTLARGEVECEVTPRWNRPRFEVLAADVTVKVVGTHFTVARRAAISVKVARGKVSVSSAEGTRVLIAGEEWTAEVTAERAGDMEALATGIPSQSQIPIPIQIQSPSQIQIQSPSQIQIQSPNQIQSPSVSVGSKNSAAHAGERLAALNAAQALEATDLHDAAAQYLALSGGNDKVAAHALKALALLELAHFAHPAEAIKLSKDYEKRFPQGDDLDDAMWIRIEAFHDAGNSTAAHTNAAVYLQRFPHGRNADRVRTILAE